VDLGLEPQSGHVHVYQNQENDQKQGCFRHLFFDLCNNALWSSEVGSGCIEIMKAEINRCDASG
jgi:hypothetical protein